jgi:hypothetical protein
MAATHGKLADPPIDNPKPTKDKPKKKGGSSSSSSR